MIVYLASDHAGFELKKQLKKFLTKKGYEVEDMGPFTFKARDDYPDFMHPLLPPLFPTKVSGERLVAACREFWQEINDKKYIKKTEDRLLSITGY